MDLAHCRSCGAPVVWTVTENAKRMPVDADPVEGGKFVLDEDTDPPTARYDLKGSLPGDHFQAHFATCPDAARHRRAA